MGKLTIKQKKFADALLKSGNGTQAVVEAGYAVQDRKSAGVISAENLTKLSVRQYLEEMSKGAAQRVVDLSVSAENEAVKLSANKDILDRSGFKPVEKMEITVPKPLMDNV